MTMPFAGTGASAITALAPPANYSTLNATAGSHSSANDALAIDPLAPLSPPAPASTQVEKKSPTVGSFDQSSFLARSAVVPISEELVVAGAQLSPATFVVNFLEGKASLANVPFNLRGVEQALQTALSDLERLGAKLVDWADENEITIVVVVASAVAAGGVAAFYLRRSASTAAAEREEEASSNWLFVRLQTMPGEL